MAQKTRRRLSPSAPSPEPSGKSGKSGKSVADVDRLDVRPLVEATEASLWRSALYRELVERGAGDSTLAVDLHADAEAAAKELLALLERLGLRRCLHGTGANGRDRVFGISALLSGAKGLCASRTLSADEAALAELRVGLQLLKGAAPSAPANWSQPMTVWEWAKLFSVSNRLMGEMLRGGKVRCEKITRQNYRVMVDDIPLQHRHRFLPASADSRKVAQTGAI
jgi:hypothetical protein